MNQTNETFASFDGDPVILSQCKFHIDITSQARVFSFGRTDLNGDLAAAIDNDWSITKRVRKDWN